MPFDIPVEAFAVEVGGGTHPAVRSLGDRRLVYVEHRIAVRRAYRRRQLFLAIGFSGAFVVVAAAALAPRGAVATDSGPEPVAARAAAPVAAPSSRPIAESAPSVRPEPPVRPADPKWRRSWRHAPTPAPAGAGASAVAVAVPDDRDLPHVPVPPVAGYQGGPLARAPFLVCTRFYESVYAGGYNAKSPGGQYSGAYQFDQQTWDHVAPYAGHPELVGVDPATAEPWIQDLLAYALYKWQGASHWNYRCDGLP